MACVLVCVTAQPSSHRLIAAGDALAAECALPLQVLAVAGSGQNLLELPHVITTLDALYARARSVGAEMTMLTDRDPRRAIADFARKCGATHLVMGKGGASPDSLQSQLARALPQVAFHIYDAGELPDA